MMNFDDMSRIWSAPSQNDYGDVVVDTSAVIIDLYRFMPGNTGWQNRHALHLLFLGYRGALRFECPFTIVSFSILRS